MPKSWHDSVQISNIEKEGEKEGKFRKNSWLKWEQQINDEQRLRSCLVINKRFQPSPKTIPNHYTRTLLFWEPSILLHVSPYQLSHKILRKRFYFLENTHTHRHNQSCIACKWLSRMWMCFYSLLYHILFLSLSLCDPLSIFLFLVVQYNRFYLYS